MAGTQIGVWRATDNASVCASSSLADPGKRQSEPTVLFVEPDFTGHRQRDVEWAVQAFTEAGRRCLVATDDRAWAGLDQARAATLARNHHHHSLP